MTVADDFPRTIKPRRRTYKPLPVIAIAGPIAVNENGETMPSSELVTQLPDLPPTLFAKLAAADWLGELNAQFCLSYPTSWQWRTATHERDVIRPDGAKVAARVSTLVHYFGWKGGNYHKLIDPVAMYGTMDVLWPDAHEWPSLGAQATALIMWATALRDFCAENGIEVRPTIGAISAQLLTDRRFYPNARRKVPAKINERIRDHQPGNFYTLNVQPSPKREFTALYLDQTRAHHYHAYTTPLPDSDHLYAYGRFTDLAECPFDSVGPDFYGLYCLDLQSPKRGLPFTWLPNRYQHPVLEKFFVYSNELIHLLDMGYTVLGVRAAWGSRFRDTGLPLYAQWADKQLDKYGSPSWLKPLLLAAYGTLATRPTSGESVFRLAKTGEPVTIRTGHRQLNGRLIQAPRKLEPRIANVLHRGMIEAATRSESVGLAQWLDSLGHRVLSIYADAVIVEQDDDHKLPLLPEPWRCKKELTHLQFVNQQAFVSDSMTKLPGVSREPMKYRQQRKPGHAPRVVQYEALTGKRVQTDRRI